MSATHAISALSNAEVARQLEELGHTLEASEATPFRGRAYLNAAAMVRDLPVPVSELYADEGAAGLERIRGVGPGIARAIASLLETGRLPMLDRLRSEADPVARFASVPGIGRALAARLHEELGVATLEELELAAHDGRLGSLPGFGPRRVAAIAAAVAHRLGRPRGERSTHPADLPPVEELLDVDQEYRESAERGRLTLIAPRRFNPERRPWLPVMHTARGARHYTALYSNTALAHRLGRTHDWVVIYGDGREEHQATVVTARGGPLTGLRVVRGREAECLAHYRESRPALRAGKESPDDHA
jgi:hypothetical protein